MVAGSARWRAGGAKGNVEATMVVVREGGGCVRWGRERRERERERERDIGKWNYLNVPNATCEYIFVVWKNECLRNIILFLILIYKFKKCFFFNTIFLFLNS